MEDNEIVKKVKEGRIFIYPTDTVYGLGCDATNKKTVEKIKKIKKRDKDKPLSVIAPSLEWIRHHLIVGDLDLSKYFPGAYTVVLKKKDKEFLKHVSSGDSLGVRIPSSKFCDKIRQSGAAFVTTSVNLRGKKPVKSVDKIPHEILNEVDEVVDEGVLDSKPSILVIDGEEVGR